MDLFYDSTNHKINYVDENNASYACNCVEIIAGVQHIDGPLQVKHWGRGPDPYGVDAYVGLMFIRY